MISVALLASTVNVPVRVTSREWWVSLYPDSMYISGTMEIRFTPLQALDSIPLWLGAEHQAETVLVNGNPAAFSRDGDMFWILEGVLPGETVVVRVAYRGRPARGLYRESIRQLYYTDIQSAGGYKGSYHLFPCFNDWSQKAPLLAHYSVPLGFKVAANGVLVGVDTSGDRAWFHWEEAHPIAIHYITFVACPELWEGGFDYNGVPIKLYAHPLDTQKIKLASGSFPDMLDLFQWWTGTPFPYADEKCGFACLGYYLDGMEYQNLVFLGVQTYDTAQRAQEIQAHELSHQWFGDFVTPARRDESWLAEGPATYFGLLYTLHTRGPEAFMDRMREYKDLYLADESRYGAIPLAGADPDHMSYSATIYGKGAWVLHTLRFITGDSAFREILKRYLSDRGEGSAVSEDLEAAAQEAYGDLSWFFEQWVMSPGHPVFSTRWWEEAGSVLVSIEQVQPSDFPTYTLPVEVAFYRGDSFLLDTLWVSSRADTFLLDLGFTPDSVKFDPNEWILAEWEGTGVQEPSPPRRGESKPAFGAPEVPISAPANLWDPTGRLVRRFKPPMASLRGLRPGVYLLVPQGGRPKKLVVLGR